jgi:hypothetical protein
MSLSLRRTFAGPACCCLNKAGMYNLESIPASKQMDTIIGEVVDGPKRDLQLRA